MQIALFGATGAVGGYFLNKALAAGHEVTTLVRSPEKLGDQPNLRAVKGNVTEASDVQSVINQADVVVSCLGNVKGVMIMKRAVEAILQAAAAQPDMPKCLFVSSIGCGGSSWVVLQLLRLINSRAGFADYERADARIAREANVPYVLIRPAALKEKPGTENTAFSKAMGHSRDRWPKRMSPRFFLTRWDLINGTAGADFNWLGASSQCGRERPSG